MQVLVINSFAHRLMNNNLIESATIDRDGDAFMVNDDWEHRTANSMDLTDAELSTIAAELRKYSSIFSPEGYKLPHREPMKAVVINGDEARA